MHGVVLQSREAPSVRPMFHVKHFCVKTAPAIRPSTGYPTYFTLVIMPAAMW